MKTTSEHLTVDRIIELYNADELLSLPIDVLRDAWAKIAMYHDYQIQHPEFSSPVVPAPSVLKPICDAILKSLESQVGLDGMTPILK